MRWKNWWSKNHQPAQQENFIRPMLNSPVQGSTTEADKLINKVAARMAAAHEANKMIEWLKIRFDFARTILKKNHVGPRPPVVPIRPSYR